jgi:TRAP-type C4-dicarboxylate transport system permease small subunit
VPVPSPRRPSRREAIISRIYDRFLDALELVPGILIGIIALVIGLDVLLRNIGYIGLKGMIELIEYALFGLTFIGIAPAMRRGAHVSVDILLMKLEGRYRRTVLWLVRAISVAIAAMIAVSAWIGLADAVASGTQVYKNFIFPEWILFAVILSGTLLFTIECLRQLKKTPDDPADGKPTETVTV